MRSRNRRAWVRNCSPRHRPVPTARSRNCGAPMSRTSCRPSIRCWILWPAAALAGRVRGFGRRC
ncbi:MAG: hypothetical protein E6R07_11720 [Nevskiaceae bacterium]|nr:MAG: hypothetical protein E6R07_11720 [Nevskiaceae bacterium]